MHELSIAQALVSQADEIARDNKAKRIVNLEISVGALSGVVKECLEFCFPEVIRGTFLENTNLMIKEIPLKVYCEECEKFSFPDIYLVRCCNCNSFKINVVEGKECKMVSMEVE